MATKRNKTNSDQIHYDHSEEIRGWNDNSRVLTRALYPSQKTLFPREIQLQNSKVDKTASQRCLPKNVASYPNKADVKAYNGHAMIVKSEKAYLETDLDSLDSLSDFENVEQIDNRRVTTERLGTQESSRGMGKPSYENTQSKKDQLLENSLYKITIGNPRDTKNATIELMKPKMVKLMRFPDYKNYSKANMKSKSIVSKALKTDSSAAESVRKTAAESQAARIYNFKTKSKAQEATLFTDSRRNQRKSPPTRNLYSRAKLSEEYGQVHDQPNELIFSQTQQNFKLASLMGTLSLFTDTGRKAMMYYSPRNGEFNSQREYFLRYATKGYNQQPVSSVQKNRVPIQRQESSETLLRKIKEEEYRNRVMSQRTLLARANSTYYSSYAPTRTVNFENSKIQAEFNATERSSSIATEKHRESLHSIGKAGEMTERAVTRGEERKVIVSFRRNKNPSHERENSKPVSHKKTQSASVQTMDIDAFDSEQQKIKRSELNLFDSDHHELYKDNLVE